ncbi:MAG: hypothetical protein QM504_06735 [Pseudomonadota bacterium]
MIDDENILLNSGNASALVSYTRKHEDFDFESFRDSIILNGDFKDSLYFIMFNSTRGDIQPLLNKLFLEGSDYEFQIISRTVDNLHQLGSDNWKASPEFDSMNEFYVEIKGCLPVLESVLHQNKLLKNRQVENLVDFAKSNNSHILVDFKSIESVIVDEYLKNSTNINIRETLISFAKIPGVDVNNIITEVLKARFTYSSVTDYTNLANISQSDVTRLQDVIMQKGEPMDLVYFAFNVKKGVDLEAIAENLHDSGDEAMIIQIEHLIDVNNNRVEPINTKGLVFQAEVSDAFDYTEELLDMSVLKTAGTEDMVDDEANVLEMGL